MSNISVLLGERIRNLRKMRGWSQEDLANRAEIARSFMGEIERGQASPSIESLEKVANALETTLEYMVKDLKPTNKDEYNLVMETLHKISAENLKELLEFIDALYKLKTKSK